jgi:hypothetical protein
MESWYDSDITHTCMEGLIKRGLLHVRTAAIEWLVPDREESPTSPGKYVMSFMAFLVRGLMTPPHQFLWGLLHHYKIELQHLNPNRI